MEELGPRSRSYGSEQWFGRGISGSAMGRRWEAERRDSAVAQQRWKDECFQVTVKKTKKQKKISYVGVCVFCCCFVFLFGVGKKRDCEFCRAGQRLVEWTMPVVTQVRREWDCWSLSWGEELKGFGLHNRKQRSRRIHECFGLKENNQVPPFLQRGQWTGTQYNLLFEALSCLEWQ